MRIYWFSISTNGYGSPPISMISPSATGAQTDSAGNVYVLTDSQGNFDISANNACPSPSTPMYLLAMQGDPAGTSQNNPYAAMAAVAPAACGADWSIDITHTTTVATAYALSSFATVSTDSFATNSSSLPALQSAAAYAGTLINSSNGVIPSGSAWEETLNTLADMIEPCVNSPSACPALFSAATPPGGVAPVDTFQAALDIALNPTLNLTALFDAIPSSPDFAPILSAIPASWIMPGSSAQISSLSDYTGTSITINGSGFGSSQGTSLVVIDGVTATVTSWSDTAIVASIPASAGSGAAQVFVNGYGSNSMSFEPPVSGSSGLSISLSLSTGPPQMGLVITPSGGSHFGSAKGQVTLNGQPMIIVPGGWTDGAITVQVPSGASSGNVVVTTGGTASDPQPFTVTAPFGCNVP